jgi:hypothetical protein
MLVTGLTFVIWGFLAPRFASNTPVAGKAPGTV